jgi:hypothetical protein
MCLRKSSALPYRRSTPIVDNYATHKHPKVRQWLARHRRWTFHFTPTSVSWLNAVEGSFSKLVSSVLRRIRVAARQELKDRIVVAMDYFNQCPSPLNHVAHG